MAVLSLLVGFAETGDIEDELREQIRQDDPALTEAELDTAVQFASFAVVVGLMLGLVFAGVWVWMAVMNSRGRSWARVVAAILGGLNITFTVLGLVLGAAVSGMGTGADVEQSAIGTVLSIASAGLAAIILILLFQPVSSAYYNAVTHWRSGPRWGYGPGPVG